MSRSIIISNLKMMRAPIITLGSIVLTTAVISNAYFQKKQFYPSVVYITKSNPSMAVIYLQAFVLVLLMGKLVRKVFFGQLRAAEMEHLIERSWYAVTETCLAFTVFRDDFSPKFVALFTLLLFLKCFHWLAEDRVDYMERSPVISWLFHIRVVSLLILLGVLDYVFVCHAYHSTLTKGASVQLVFGFEYAILFTVVANILVKYMLHTIDLQRENPWENKAVYLLYTELLMGFFKVVLYLTFMTIMIKIHTFPLFAIRPMYLSMRAFKKAINDVVMSRRAIRNMNTLYPDATAEDLAASDNVCIICREEMVGAGGSKKLPCNHIFHASCLRSWFQRQQTCPTCRMDVLRGTAQGLLRPPQQGAQQQPQQPQAGAQPQALPNWPGMAQGAQFPFPFAFMQPQQQQQQPGQAQPPPGQSQGAEASGPSSNSSASAAAGRTRVLMPLFPFPPFCFLPPPPVLPLNLDPSLSVEELRAMEGQERENVEARIQCLRNIQTLLDAAVLQMQQYTSLVSSLRTTEGNAQGQADTASSSSSPPQPSPATTTTTAPESSPGPSQSKQSPKSSAPSQASTSRLVVDDDNDDAQSEIRRRRLQRFATSGNNNNSGQQDDDLD